MSETAVVKQTMKTLGEVLRQKQDQLSRLLPRHLTLDKLMGMANAALSRNPKLAECDALSVLDCNMKAAVLGVELNGPLQEAFMIPYWNGQAKRMEAQFQFGYRGLMKLARNSGKIPYIDAHVVREGDDFQFEYGTNQFLKHVPGQKRGDVYAAYAIAKMSSGDFIFEVLHADDLEKIRQSSKKPDSGPWEDWTEEMHRKSPIKRLCKRLPLEPEVQQAIVMDDQSQVGQVQDRIIDIESLQMQQATLTKTEELKGRLNEAKDVPQPAPIDKTDPWANTVPLTDPIPPTPAPTETPKRGPGRPKTTAPQTQPVPPPPPEPKELAKEGLPSGEFPPRVDPGVVSESDFGVPTEPERTITQDQRKVLLDWLNAVPGEMLQKKNAVIERLKGQGIAKLEQIPVSQYADWEKWVRELRF